MMKEEKEAKLAALSLAKELNNPSLIAEAYSELTHYYAWTMMVMGVSLCSKLPL